MRRRHEGCIFFDPKLGRCARGVKLSQGPPMQLFQDYKARLLLDYDELELGSDILDDIHRAPSGSHVMSEGVWACDATDATGIALPARFPCGGYMTWGDAFKVNRKLQLFFKPEDVISHMANELILTEPAEESSC